VTPTGQPREEGNRHSKDRANEPAETSTGRKNAQLKEQGVGEEPIKKKEGGNTSRPKENNPYETLRQPSEKKAVSTGNERGRCLDLALTKVKRPAGEEVPKPRVRIVSRRK